MLQGEGVTKDPVEAVKWYRKAAEQGNASAQFNLGECFMNGRGVAKDPVEAVKWYHMASEQGHADTEYNFGVCQNSEGVAKDPVEVVKWYRKAAEQGLPEAMFILQSPPSPISFPSPNSEPINNRANGNHTVPLIIGGGFSQRCHLFSSLP
jgi:TPR repeat protein